MVLNWLSCGMGRRAAMLPGPGIGHIEHRGAVGVHGARADVGDRQNGAWTEFALDVEIPDFVVFDLEIVIQVVAAHRSQAGGGQGVLDLEAWAEPSALELTVLVTKNGRFCAKFVTMLYAAWLG